MVVQKKNSRRSCLTIFQMAAFCPEWLKNRKNTVLVTDMSNADAPADRQTDKLTLLPLVKSQVFCEGIG